MPPQFQLGYCHSPNYFYIPATVQETQYSPASSPPESVISESSQYSNSPSPINPNFNIPSLNPISPYYTPYQEQPQHDQPTYVSRREPTPWLNKSRITKRPTHPKKVEIAHPYARLYSKEKETKRRKIWNHALEKSIFTPLEMYGEQLSYSTIIFQTKRYYRSTVSAPQRRKVYIASLEAHVDRLHAQLLEYVDLPFSTEMR